MEKLSLIDMSSDDDLLPSSQCDRDLTYSENNNDHEEVYPVKMSNQLDHIPNKSESPEQKRTKPVKVNLRKSLAWDNAFLTNEGVLNTEELGIVNSTFRKTEACSLTGIPEDLRKSSESTSTLDSDCYSLASLEGDLFNLRASIQMSVSRNDNTTTVEPTPSCLNDAVFRLAAEKGDEVPSQKIKPPTTSRKAGMNKQQTDQTSNAVKKGTDNSKLAPKPPRMVPKSTSSSMQLKSNTKRTSSSGIASISKTNGDSANRISRSAGLPKPTPPVKNPTTTSTNSSSKSPLDNPRKRPSTRNTDNALSRPTTKTPTQISKSRLPSNYTSKLSGKTSPTSSTDSFASEASSSASLSSLKPRNSVESFTSSNSSSPSLKKRVSPSNLQGRVSTVRASVSVSAVAETFKKDNPARASISSCSSTGAKSFIPTGLRMPSPKIGYFDSEKNQGNNTTKTPHSDLRRSSMIKPRSTKIPSLKPAPKPATESSRAPQPAQTPQSSPIHKKDKTTETEPDSSVSDNVQKENLFPTGVISGANDDSVLDKMATLSISTEKEYVAEL